MPAIPALLTYTLADIPPAMALGVEPAEIGLMKRQPRNPQQGVLTKVTWLIIFMQSMLIALLTIAVYVVALNHLQYPVEAAQSLVSVTRWAHTI
jgi:Ca2+-transporting ATPase